MTENFYEKVLKNVGTIHMVIGFLGGVISAFIESFFMLLIWWWIGFSIGLIYLALSELFRQSDEKYSLQVQQMNHLERKLDGLIEKMKRNEGNEIEDI
jgi:hypothetical protein